MDLMLKRTLYLPDDLALKVAAAAEELGMSKSAYIRRALQRAVDEALRGQETFQERDPSVAVTSIRPPTAAT